MEPNPLFDDHAQAAFRFFIARMVKHESLGWTVIHFDAAAPRNGWGQGQPRDHFEYEITAEMAGEGPTQSRFE